MALTNARCSAWTSSCGLDAPGAGSATLPAAPISNNGFHTLQISDNTPSSYEKGSTASRNGLDAESNGLNRSAAHVPVPGALKSPSYILGMGTANPESIYHMIKFGKDIVHGFGYDDLPEVADFTDRICKSSGITKKHMTFDFELYMNEESLITYGAPSLDKRFKLFETEAIKIGTLAGERALSDWGGDRSKITHLITYSTTGMLSPAIDMRLMKALGLSQNVKHFWVSLMGCHAGLIGIRTAAEIAQADANNRVLVVCVEINSSQAQPLNPDAPNEMNNMVVSIIFGDGAAGIVIGMQPTDLETPVFEIDRCQTSYIPDTDYCITARLTESGLQATLDKSVPFLVGKNSGKFVAELLQGSGVCFETVNWAVHPGGKAVVDAVEKGCHLVPEQTRFSRYILDNYANMSSPTIIFVLDKIRADARNTNQSAESTRHLIHPWTVALGFGPGLTIEGILMKFC